MNEFTHPGGTTTSVKLRAAMARRLESRRPVNDRAAQLLSLAWGLVSARGVARPLAVPPGIRAIGVGGASLGGSCKTPFAIALAEALTRRGIDVAVVGHAYRARPDRARIVSPDDDVRDVGDDALFAARRLARSGISVIVGPNRQSAVTFAARRAPWLVIDGLLQARPHRLARSILLLDGRHPWGSGHCPPAGDLRAPPRALLQAADAAVVVQDEVDGTRSATHVVWNIDRATSSEGREVALSELCGSAVGLVLTIARPDRVVEALARRGLQPRATLAFPDHYHPTPSELELAIARTTHRIEVWLTTGKCATKLAPTVAGAPVLVLEHALRLPDRLVEWVASGS